MMMVMMTRMMMMMMMVVVVACNGRVCTELHFKIRKQGVFPHNYSKWYKHTCVSL
jgi:hypothetical protein